MNNEKVKYVGLHGAVNIIDSIRELQDFIHQGNVNSGWWRDAQILKELAATGDFDDAFMQRMQVTIIASKLALVHSEVSEGLEGLRKDLPDDKLPHRPMLAVEAADAIIRILDIAGYLELDVAGALIEKLSYNAERADHKIENRDKAGGKTI